MHVGGIARTEFLPHDETTSLRSLTRELDWNADCYCFARGISPPRALALPSRFLEDSSPMRWSGA